MADWTWGEFAAQHRVVHQQTANTDHDDAAVLKRGYDYQNFDGITPTPNYCYPLHEESGTTAYDLAGPNDGSASGTTTGAAGILDTTAYTFTDADTSHIDIGTTGISGGDAHTVAAWVRLNTAPNSDATVYFQGDRSDGDQLHVFFNTSASVLEYGWFGDDLVGATDISDGAWHHVVATYDGTDRTLYLDGSVDASDSPTTPSIADNDNTIGSFVDDFGNVGKHWEGELADVRLYDTSLTGAQAQTLYDVAAGTGDWTSTKQTL